MVGQRILDPFIEVQILVGQLNLIIVRTLFFYLKGFIIGTGHYLETFSYKSIKSKEYSDLIHSPRGLEEDKLAELERIYPDFIKTYPIVAGFMLSVLSTLISLIALVVAIFK